MMVKVVQVFFEYFNDGICLKVGYCLLILCIDDFVCDVLQICEIVVFVNNELGYVMEVNWVCILLLKCEEWFV